MKTLESPKRKLQKENDYRRHALLRKIKRRRKSRMELLKKGNIPTYEDGKDYGENVFRNDLTGDFFYQASPDSEKIDLTPLNTSLGDDPALWTFTDSTGKVYKPKLLPISNQDVVQEAHNKNRLSRVIDNYIGELKYDLNNGVPVGGKYTIPAIAASALLPLAGEAFAGTSIAGIPATTWADAALTAGFGAHGLNHAINEGIDGWGDAAMTALEVAPLGRLAKPMFNEAAMAIENYRYPLGRPQVPENFLTIKPQIRTRVGDVEVDNPNVLYHTDWGDGIGAMAKINEYQGIPTHGGPIIRDGFLYPGASYTEGQKAYTWWNLGKPWNTPSSGSRLTTTNVDNPFLFPVRSSKEPIGQWNGREGFVTKNEYVANEPVDVSNSTYVFKPNYGWKRVFTEETPTAEWPVGRNAPTITAENAASVVSPQNEELVVSALPDYREGAKIDYNLFRRFADRGMSKETVKSVETLPNNMDLTSNILLDLDKRFMMFEPGKFINHDIGAMSIEEVVNTFGPEAEHYKKLYDVAKAHNFEGKYAKIGQDAEYNILNRFAINKADPDVAKGIAEARSIYDIPEYRVRFNRWGTLGDTFVDDALARIDNVKLQGRSKELPIKGQHGVHGGAYTSPDATTIGITNSDSSSWITDMVRHEANHVAHGLKRQPDWMRYHNEKIRPVIREGKTTNTPLDKYYDEMDEIVERSKTAIEYANKIRKEGETLNQALTRLADMTEANIYNAEIPADIRQSIARYTKDSMLNFWKNFVGGYAAPIGIGLTGYGLFNNQKDAYENIRIPKKKIAKRK